MKINALLVATKDRPKPFCRVVHTLFSLSVAIVVICLLDSVVKETPNRQRTAVSRQPAPENKTSPLSYAPLH